MNNLFKFALVVTLAVTLTACGNNNNDNNDQNNATDDTVNNGEVNDGANTTDQNNGNDDMNGNDNNDNFSFSDEAADKVAAMDEVDNATVVMMNNDAYVAVGLTEGTNESEELTKRISDEVKNIDANIEQVYVSANPDFLKEINDYRTKFNEGKPVEGFFEEVGDAVQRAFPDAK